MNGSERNGTLSERQQKAIPIILGAKNIEEGVKRAKIGKTTFYLWLRDTSFKGEFERRRQEIIEDALHSLKVSAGEAVEVLRALLKAEQEGVRLKTATAILEHIAKFIELENIEKRLSELERSIDK